MEDGDKGLKQLERSRSAQEKTQNQLTWAHSGPQETKPPNREHAWDGPGPSARRDNGAAWAACESQQQGRAGPSLTLRPAFGSLALTGLPFLATTGDAPSPTAT